MKLSLPLTTIALLALGSSAQASFIVSPSSKKTTFFKSTSTSSYSYSYSSSSLYARPNRNVPTSDPYASLINKVDPSASSSTSSTPDIDIDIIPQAPDNTKAAVVEQMNNLVDQVNQAANTAIEASNKVTEISAASGVTSSSLASDVLPAAVDTTSAQSIAESTTTTTTTTPTVTDTLSSSAAEAASSSGAATEESYQKVPTLFEFIQKGGVSPTTSTVSPTTKEKLILLKSNLVAPVENTVNTVVAPTATKALSETSKSAKGIFGSTSQGLNEVTQSAKSLVSGVGATGAVGAASTTATSPDGSSTSFDAAGLNQLMENLQLNTYGPWIIGGASIFYAFNAKEAGRKEAIEQYESELKSAQQKAQEAANAAEIAAKGAHLAKALVESNMDVLMDRKKNGNVGEEMLENSRIELVQVENVRVT